MQCDSYVDNKYIKWNLHLLNVAAMRNHHEYISQVQQNFNNLHSYLFKEMCTLFIG